MLTALITGFTVGLGLILAIGAQNAFVLKQGLRNEHIFAVVLTCALSDALGIVLGVAGFTLVISALPWLDTAMRLGGALFLLAFGARSFYAALTSNGTLSPLDAPSNSRFASIMTCLAFTWLNPHFYLDTIVLIGTLSTRHLGLEMAFAMGAISASFVFFFTLGFSARALRPILATPRAWQILDIIIGVVMWVIATQLVIG